MSSAAVDQPFIARGAQRTAVLIARAPPFSSVHVTFSLALKELESSPPVGRRVRHCESQRRTRFDAELAHAPNWLGWSPVVQCNAKRYTTQNVCGSDLETDRLRSFTTRCRDKYATRVCSKI
jgi:hypothetical protein